MSIFPYFPASGVPPSSDEPGQWGVFHESRDAEAQVQLWLQFFLLFFVFFDALEIEWRFEMLTFFLFWRLGDWEILQIFIFLDASLSLRFRPAGCDWCWWYQDERNDGQILKDVLFSISEWKDRQQRKLLHQLFHRYFHNLIKSILSGLWNAVPTYLSNVHNVCPSSAKKRFLFSAVVEEMRRWLVMATWVASGMR